MENKETSENKEVKIIVNKTGSYFVSGKIKLKEKILVEEANKIVLKEGKDFGEMEDFYLCRCGRSKKHPFCDGTHKDGNFDGELKASSNNLEDVVKVPERKLIEFKNKNCDSKGLYNEDIEGMIIEKLEQSEDETLVKTIYIIQDEKKNTSAGIWVFGAVPIEDKEGNEYKVSDNYALCRCGKSKKKPFCDLNHVHNNFNDGYSNK